MKLEVSQQISEKKPKYQISSHSVQLKLSSMRMDRRTMTKLNSRFSQFSEHA